MGIFGALTTAVTGMRAQSFALENISGNIANSQTTAFKREDTSFVDLILDNIPTNQLAGNVSANSRSTNSGKATSRTLRSAPTWRSTVRAFSWSRNRRASSTAGRCSTAPIFRQRLVVTVERFEGEAVVEQHMRCIGSDLHGGGDQPQRRHCVAAAKLDDAEHLQGVEVIGPRREHRRIKPLGLVDPSAMMQVECLMHGARHIEGLALQQRHRRHGTSGLDVGVGLGGGSTIRFAAIRPIGAQSGQGLVRVLALGGLRANVVLAVDHLAAFRVDNHVVGHVVVTVLALICAVGCCLDAFRSIEFGLDRFASGFALARREFLHRYPGLIVKLLSMSASRRFSPRDSELN
jgi:flagellar basal body rod protein FlgB